MKKYIDTSIFDLFKIGPGPSSSHTIGPMKAASHFLSLSRKLPDELKKKAASVDIFLYGSLSSTGKGHGTDRALAGGLLGWKPETCDCEALAELLDDENKILSIDIKGTKVPLRASDIHFEKEEHSFPFQNTMRIILKSGKKENLLEKQYYSIGGGFIICEGEKEKKRPAPPHRYRNMKELGKLIETENISLEKLILENEEILTGKKSDEIYSGLNTIAETMIKAVERGLGTEGVLPGRIGLARKAPALFGKSTEAETEHSRFLLCLNACAMAAAEENAAGHRVVTAPTSGSAGVIPGVIYTLEKYSGTPRKKILDGMLAAAAVGFIAKHNASISGAEVGCQGEIGVASAMAAAMITHTNVKSLRMTENAAEIALEHHLGITCDPVGGYVQIPCIERNAVGAVEAYNSYLLASAGDPEKQKVSLDEVIEAMLETGRDMCLKYKETSKGGLAVCAVNC